MVPSIPLKQLKVVFDLPMVYPIFLTKLVADSGALLQQKNIEMKTNVGGCCSFIHSWIPVPFHVTSHKPQFTFGVILEKTS